ncbi:hypothetical protein [Spirosoma aerolatum]|uniref:hypothetical protein n=1 Tax=Spirosoma aerolatum TaxID=1211326 RepID=UPI0009AE1E87|nr:hypothetical protein [Spirosoma aerolatum]
MNTNERPQVEPAVEIIDTELIKSLREALQAAINMLDKVNKKPQKPFERLRQAYKDVSPSLRSFLTADFCVFHNVTPGTFRKKRRGENPVTEREIQFVQQWQYL